MRNAVSAQRFAIDQIIRRDPVQVTVQRRTWTEQDGGRAVAATTHGPFTIYVFAKVDRGFMGDVTGDAGSRRVLDWQALAYHDADFRFGAFVEDTFTIPDEGTFTVREVVPLKVGRGLGGYHLFLERVY